MPPEAALLPILLRQGEILAALRAHRVLVLTGATGSGKTTQLPQMLLDAGLAPRGVIGHTQPRRLAARSVAARIAQERAVRLGDEVGFKVRFEDRTSARTRIKVMTDGMLLAELAADPDLRAYSAVIVDEAHERSLDIDLLLGCLRALLRRRDDLRLIVTSATIEPRRFSDYFGGPAVAPVVEVSGRTFPVEIRHRPPEPSRRDQEDPAAGPEEIADAVEELLSPRLLPGDVLVFLPGEREIRLAGDALRRRRLDAEILPLFSRLTSAEQDRIFAPAAGRPRVILATNIAETSLTVPGIRYVVDTGLARLSRYDPARKIRTLPIEPISRASADQRSGRCGRVAAGVAIRLYSEADDRARPPFTQPEIGRADLASLILRMHTLGLGPVESFPFLQPPDPAGIADGHATLFELGALDQPGPGGRLTDVGRRMARLPLDPRVARMLLAAEAENAVRETIVLAAALSIQDPRERPMGRQEEADRAQAVFRSETSDFLTLLSIFDQHRHAAETLGASRLAAWCRDHFLSPARMREWTEIAAQLRSAAEELDLPLDHPPASEDAIHRALLPGLISNLACREGDAGFDYRGVRGNVVSLFPGSVLFRKAPRWIMAAEIVQTTRLYARIAAKVDPAWVEAAAAHVFTHHREGPHLDPETGVPSVWERLTMSGIVVVPRRRAPLAPHDPAAARDLFLREALAAGRWRTDAPFALHNQSALALARRAEAKLRARNVLASADDLAALLDARLPPHILDGPSLLAWVASHGDAAVRLAPADLLRPSAAAAADPALYPDSLTLPGAPPAPLDYALAPGKDDDGLTLTLPLLDLPLLPPDRPAWLVPGFLPELIAALIKLLPKPLRAALDRHGEPAALAAAVAPLLDFAAAPLPAALSEAFHVLHDASIPVGAWNLAQVPLHLRLRIRVVDDAGRELAVERDLAILTERLAGRLRRAQAGAARRRFRRDGLTTWDFPDLPDAVEIDADGPAAATPRRAHPALVDAGDSVSLTLLDSPRHAAAASHLGLRRLLALAIAGELAPTFPSLPAWDESCRHFKDFGGEPALRDGLALHVADRVFLSGQAPIRTREQFEARKEAHWGRLGAVLREVGEVAARILEPRALVARRLAGGTPRLWAQSVADLREQAAFLMPPDWLRLLPWERLRRYPIYVEAMRQRLLGLREDGSGSEKAQLAAFAPHWKRLTAWVAAAMAAQRAIADAAGPAPDGDPDAAAPAAPGAKGRPALPRSRRAAPVVNVDAGTFALHPAALPPHVETYRWALEEAKVALFVPSLQAAPALTELDALWRKAEPPPTAG